MSEKIIFRLQRFMEIKGETVDLYEAIKADQKTSEFRDFTAYWEQKLCPDLDIHALSYNPSSTIYDITHFLKPKKAWFIVGYPKGNLPRLETDITKLRLHFVLDMADQFEILFKNVKEVSFNGS